MQSISGESSDSFERASNLLELADLTQDKHALEESESLYREEFTIKRRLHSKNSKTCEDQEAKAYVHLASCLLKQRKFCEAERLLRQSLHDAESDLIHQAVSLQLQAEFLHEAGDREFAQTKLRQSLEA